MYIATHLGWVVLSCAVLMFFRKRSIQKTNKKSNVSGILPSPAQPGAPSPHGRAPLGMHQAWQRGRVSAELGGLQSRGEPSPGGSLSRFPSIGFGVPRYKISHCFPAAGCPGSARSPCLCLAPGYWGRCSGRGGLVLHRADQYCTCRVGRDAISGLRGA